MQSHSTAHHRQLQSSLERYSCTSNEFNMKWAVWLPPVRRRSLRLLIFCCVIFLIIAVSPRLAWANAQIQTGTTPTTAFLQLNDQILLDAPGFHLSKPTLSPDGRWLAVTVAPTGAGTAFLAEILVFAVNDGAQVARLVGYSPVWSSDSHVLSFQNAAGGAAYYPLAGRWEQVTFAPRHSDDALIMTMPQFPLAYPQTIRVAHHPSNGCRDVADWQVDVLPFEAYVALVVPAEVPASWPPAALEAMAVAARTYAWRQILVGRPDYDVTDWANFQVMCADRYPSTDAAVTATTGQYLTAKHELPGVPISAMYSAENGHPTLTNSNVTYLQAVPDLLALGRERWGHGYGLSQWGAYRRARAGQNYRQILGHYYSAVTLQNAAAPSQPAAALLGLLPQSSVATDGLHLTTLGPADWLPRLVVTATAGLSAPLTFSDSEAVWRAAQPLPENSIVTAQLWLQEQLYDQVAIRVDHSAPSAPTLQTAAVITQPLANISIPTVTDVTPLINTQWSWAGELLLHTANSGAVVTDAQAPDGSAWAARVGVQQKGVWYGPRTTLLPAGYNYRALFWLRAGTGLSAAAAAQMVARLDVTDDEGRELLGLRDLWTSDFADSVHYHPLAVDFHLFQAPRGLEFRVAWPGLVDLALDRVEIWRLPSTGTATTQQFSLPFYGQLGNFALEAAQMDSAGNLSQATKRLLTLVDNDPPQVGPSSLPTTWLATNTITISVPVTDSFSGLDHGYFTVAGQTYSVTLPATLPTDKLPWQGHQLTTALQQVPDGEHALTLHALDRAGNQRQQRYALRVDTVPPTISAHISATLLNGWYGEPLQLQLAAADNASGVADITYKVAALPSTVAIAQQAVQSYTQPISLTTSGVHEITYTAVDYAGNVAASQVLTVALDVTPPTVHLQQVNFYTEAVRLTWQVYDAGSGVEQLEMQLQQGDEEWEPAPWDYTTETMTELVLDPERPTKVRARAADRFGHRSEWITLALWRATAWIYLPIVQR